MTTRFAICGGAIPTAVTTQNYTNTDLGGESGICAFGMIGTPTALDAAVSANCHASIGTQGASGFGDDVAHAFAIDDSITATTQHARSARQTSRLYKKITGNSWTETEGGYISAYVTNGATISNQVAGTAHYLSMGVWNGNGLNYSWDDTATGSTAQDGTLTVSGLSFEPDALIVICSDSTGSSAHSYYSFGFATNETSIKQRCYTWGCEDNTSPTAHTAILHTDRCGQMYTSGATTRLSSIEVTAFNSDGYTMTVRDAASATEQVQVLALKSSDWIFRLVDFDIPTSGNVSVDAGIDLATEGGILGVCTHLAATDTGATDNTCIGFSNFMYDGTLTRNLSCSHEDNVTTTNAHSVHTSDVTVLDGGGAENIEFAITPTTTGFSSTPNNYPATATKNFALLFGPENTGTTITVPTGPWR